AEKIVCHDHNRVQILDRIIERLLLEQGLVDVGERTAEEDCIAVRARTRDGCRAKRSAGATYIFNDHRAEQRLHLFSPRATKRVERPARWKRHHEPDRPRWIILRDRGVRDNWERGGARHQMKEFAARKFHVGPQAISTVIRAWTHNC